jgi:hypothetical protein
MTTYMTLSFLSLYLCLSLISVIYILMEFSQISIALCNVTLLIVISHSTFIPTYAKSSLIHVLLLIGLLDTSLIPLHSDWVIGYLLISWTLTYPVS